MASASQRLFDAIGAQLILHGSFADEPPRLGAEYEIAAIIGAGGFGLICRATQVALRRPVALKLFPLGEGDDSGVREALREARSLARLEHPGIVTVYAAGEGEVIAGERLACAYVEMQLIDGVSLREWLTGEREANEVLAILREAGRALAHAHAEGMVHRDFKPENLMIDREGRATVIDFGLALVAEAGSDAALAKWDASSDALGTRATGTGLIRGTPGYMAPEASQGRPRAASDQFALAVVIREALTGRHPYANEAEAEARIPRGGLELFGRIKPILDRAMAPSPADRFASVGELCDALAGLGGRVRGRSGGTRRWPRVALGVGLVGSLSVLGVLVWQAAGESSGAPVPEVAAEVVPDVVPEQVADEALEQVPEAEPTPEHPRIEPPRCADLDAWMGAWQATTKVTWTEYAYQFDWRVDYEFELTLADRCAVTVTARKYPPLVEGEVHGEPVEATAVGLATRDDDGLWRLPLRLAFADDTRTYSTAESYEAVLLLDRDGLPRLRGAFRKLNDDGHWIRLGVFAGARGVAPDPRSITTDALACAARCRIECAGAVAEAACFDSRCAGFNDDPADICGPPSYDFRSPVRATVARQALRAGKDPFAQALERSGARAKQLAACERNAKTLAGSWGVWIGPARSSLELHSEACELSGSLTAGAGVEPVSGYVTAAGTWVLTPDDPHGWLGESLVLVGVGERGPAFGTDTHDPPRPIRAFRAP